MSQSECQLIDEAGGWGEGVSAHLRRVQVGVKDVLAHLQGEGGTKGVSAYLQRGWVGGAKGVSAYLHRFQIREQSSFLKCPIPECFKNNGGQLIVPAGVKGVSFIYKEVGWGKGSVRSLAVGRWGKGRVDSLTEGPGGVKKVSVH